MTKYCSSVLFFLMIVIPIPSWCWEPGDEVKCPAHGVYDNDYYGFRVTLPPGVDGCPNSPVGMSDHGVAVALDRGQSRSIEAFAAYNAMFYETAHEAVTSRVEDFLSNKKYDAVTVQSRTRTRLGGLRAERLVLRYRLKSDGAVMIYDTTTTLRHVLEKKQSSEPPSHLYSVSLTSTAGHYKSDRAILDRVLKSWKPTATMDDPEPPVNRDQAAAKKVSS